MYLYINTVSHENAEVSIIGNDLGVMDTSGFSCEYQFQIKDKLLKEIDKILARNKIVLKDLNGIIAANKSKEMTSLRIGISVANALAYSLDIPVFGAGDKGFRKSRKFKPLKPEYEINPMLANVKQI